MRKVLVLMFILSISSAFFAQKGMVKGRVYNAKSNEPIEFANILIQGTLIGSTSDLDGNFIFTGINPGFIKLVVSSIGFETTVSTEIQVQGNQTTFIDIARDRGMFGPPNEATVELDDEENANKEIAKATSPRQRTPTKSI